MRTVSSGGNPAARQGAFVGEEMHKTEEIVIAFGRNVLDAELALSVGGGVEVNRENARGAVSITEADFCIGNGSALFFDDAGEGDAFEHGESVDLPAGGEFGEYRFGVIGSFGGEGGGEERVFAVNDEFAFRIAFSYRFNIVGVAVARASRASDRADADRRVRN